MVVRSLSKAVNALILYGKKCLPFVFFWQYDDVVSLFETALRTELFVRSQFLHGLAHPDIVVILTTPEELNPLQTCEPHCD